GAPLLFVFLLIGMLAGEEGPGGFAFDDYQTAYLIGSLALAVILFDGGLRTHYGAFRRALGPSVTLATLGVVLTAGFLAVPAMLIFSLTPLEALLIASIVASTDAAAVFFLLRSGGLQLRAKMGTTLEMESATNDPIAVFLTLLFVHLLSMPDAAAGDMVTIFLQQAVLGVAFGVAGGYGAVLLLNRVDLPGGLHPLFVLALAVFIFALTAKLGGSGFLAAFLAGLIIGNSPVRAFPSIGKFHDAMTWLAQIVMFIVLGLLVTPSALVAHAPAAILFALALIFVARPLAVWLCLIPFRFTPVEKGFIAWVGLRGAVSIFLASIPMLVQLPQAELFFNVAFFAVLVSLVVQGWSVNPVARALRVAAPRRLPDVNRVELDLPGQTAYELAGYAVTPDSDIIARRHAPRYASLALVVRDGKVMRAHEIERLQPGDYAYFLVRPDRAKRLDRLFISNESLATGARRIFLKLRLPGDMPLRRIEARHGLRFGLRYRDETLASFHAAKLKEAGDGAPPGRFVILREAMIAPVHAGAGTQGDAPQAFDIMLDLGAL
ncbi:MAG: potassium/proton antiporter, partial [Salinarimonas sp.]